MQLGQTQQPESPVGGPVCAPGPSWVYLGSTSQPAHSRGLHVSHSGWLPGWVFAEGALRVTPRTLPSGFRQESEAGTVLALWGLRETPREQGGTLSLVAASLLLPWQVWWVDRFGYESNRLLR